MVGMILKSDFAVAMLVVDFNSCDVGPSCGSYAPSWGCMHDTTSEKLFSTLQMCRILREYFDSHANLTSANRFTTIEKFPSIY
jgi:hypothetical protein